MFTKPFFARFLENEKAAELPVTSPATGGAETKTKKYPSDNDEMTLKYPSDGDEIYTY